MEEDEDAILLNSLKGATAANPEDIERDILSGVHNNGNGSNVGEVGGSNEEEERLEKSESIDPSVASGVKLYNKLRAVEFEIDAVESTVEPEQAGSEEGDRDGGDGAEAGNKEDNLQHALATDRLRSLKKTKAQLEKELSDLGKGRPSKGIARDKVLLDIVKDKPAPKRKSKQVQISGKKLKKRIKTVSFDEDDDFDAVLDAASAGFVETERDELVRKGILTPFHKLKGFERGLQEQGPSRGRNVPAEGGRSDDFISASVARAVQSLSEAAQARPATKLLDPEALPKLDPPTHPFKRLRKPLKIPQSLENGTQRTKSSGKKRKRPLPDKRWRKRISLEENNLLESENTPSCEEENKDDVGDVDDDEYPHVTLEGGLKIPEYIFNGLFDYQKVGVQWLWELHCQRAGGIIGDEMGLGKTIQVLSFLGALHFSHMYKPSIIVCPVTLLRQWKREAKKWYPSFHVELLHDSAREPAIKNKGSKSDESDSDSEGSSDSDYERPESSKSTKKWDSLINRVLRSESGLLITTYEQLRIVGESLLDVDWGYAVLDEGHRIRNPNAEVTLVCKQLQTVHRIIMTGAPIQNKLTELWSLFDFVFPGKLGVLPIFEAEFAVPISVGGYANASPLQVSTAYRCAVVLRDLIMPYLLRRMKADVDAQLPKKTEHVIFCSLTDEQRSAYRAFLASSEVEQIMDGNRNSLYGIDVMRKICNHPDLLEREHCGQNPDYGNLERSGKLKVVSQVLKVWKDQGHRVLLFTQTQQMLDIIESFLVADGYSYRRMDGLTPIKQRMALIDEFNNSSDVFVFILTTKVGGLGTNLTGANRVIIFDPDWNPSTDIQARERAWRIGQKRDVTIYRLITRGTIEEKVYHRQIYKHFLTNKILKNPQQRRIFKARDMKDLFTLSDDRENGSTETANLFGQLSEDANVVGVQNDKPDKQDSQRGSVRSTNGVVADKANNSESGPSRRNGKEKADQSDGEVDEETNILRCLFDAQGIHSAMNHDVIMNAHDEEKMKLDEQASRVAQRAAEALRQSRMLRSRDGVSVPTWTGKSGMAGAPSAVRGKFGSTLNSQLVKNTKRSDEGPSNSTNGFVAGAPAGKALSSAELLAKIRGNQERAVEAGIEHQFNRAKSLDVGPSRTGHNLGGVQPEVVIRDGRGYELACKLESCNVWRTWLGDSTYAIFAPFLSSTSTWEAFMDSKSRPHLHLQLRARALLFDKACVSLFLPPNSSSSSSSSSSSIAVSKLNPNYLQLHLDDVYFTLDNSSQDGVQVQQRDASVPSKVQSKAAFGAGSRYGESEIDNIQLRFKNGELPETWYNQFIERYRMSKPYRLSSVERESEKRTPEEMSAYLKLHESHKKRRAAFKEDPYMGYGNPIQDASHMKPSSLFDGSNSVDSETSFFPETMFTLNCVPDSALPPLNRVDDNKKVECYGVLDTLPQIMTRSPVMLERLGIRPEYLSMEQGGILHRRKNASGGNKKCLSQEQATQLSQKVVARMMTNIGFEGTTEVPIDVFSQLLSCHIQKLGGSLKLLADSYRKQCSALELLKMFLQTVGYGNFGALVEQVKDGSKNFQQTQQQMHGIQSQLQPQHQNLIRLPQQVRQMHPQVQQIAHSKNVPFQQPQQLERMRRRQPSTPRMGMDMEKDRPMVQVKIEAPSELPMDGNAFNSLNSRHPQMQFRQQQIPPMSNLTMSNVHAQSGNQFRQMASQIPQVQAQNMSVLRAPPVKVEGFQELMGGDASSKHDSDENRLTSPSSK